MEWSRSCAVLAVTEKHDVSVSNALADDVVMNNVACTCATYETHHERLSVAAKWQKIKRKSIEEMDDCVEEDFTEEQVYPSSGNHQEDKKMTLSDIAEV